MFTEHSPHYKPGHKSIHGRKQSQKKKKILSLSEFLKNVWFFFIFGNVKKDENCFQWYALQLNTPAPPLDVNAQQKFDTKGGRGNKSLAQMSNGPRWRQNQCLRILSDSFLESMWPNRGTKRDTSLSSFPMNNNKCMDTNCKTKHLLYSLLWWKERGGNKKTKLSQFSDKKKKQSISRNFPQTLNTCYPKVQSCPLFRE